MRPSVHPETGEAIEWGIDKSTSQLANQPERVKGAELKESVEMLAAAAPLARHGPTDHGRHDMARDLGGFLARCGFDVTGAGHFVEQVATQLGHSAKYQKDRSKAVQDAFTNFEKGGATCGLPKMREIFGEKVANAVARWLGYTAEPVIGLSEDDLALIFKERHGSSLRFTAAWGRWNRYTGTVWENDSTLMAFDLARDVIRENAVNQKARVANAVKSAKTVAAVERLARADRQIAATVDQWDRDLWLLNTPGGVVDLRTGELRRHDPLDYLTKITAVAPDPNCPTPLWTAHLKRVLADDLSDFLARILGYSLTGVTIEHALFFHYGKGRNGKGVTINTAAKIMKGYHRTASRDTFTASKHNEHSTDLAGLQGARFVTTSETEENRFLKEALIKQLTGGDPIRARFMRQDSFEFMPQLKLHMVGNHQPRLISVDEANKSRVNMIPWVVTIPKEDRDTKLEEKLIPEWPGILHWMIQGCLEWQRVGLKQPAAVLAATEEFFEGESAGSRARSAQQTVLENAP